MGALADRLVALHDKDDAIAAIVDRVNDDDAREVMYRLWCRLHHVSVLRGDLERVRKGRRRELQRRLIPR